MPKEAKNKEKKAKVKTDKKHFFKDVKAELKKVIWPTSKQLFNNTLAVIVIVLIVGAIVFVLDLCFEQINTFGINKLKEVVQTTQNSTNTENVADIEDNSLEEENTESEDNSENVSEENSIDEPTENAIEESSNQE